jgi:predicted kinase
MEAIIFTGIQATGKSTFYREHFFDTHVRINLDMLRTRHRERTLLRWCIATQQRFVVDNTNTLAAERAQYIVPAKASGFRIVGYYFEGQLGMALERNRQRSGKARVPDKGVVAMYRRLQFPRMDEGFDQLYYVRLTEQHGFAVREWTDAV